MKATPIARLLKCIDPGDALGEVLFGLIMALTFTIGARLVTGEEGLEAHDLVVATLGCNIAWGIIDAVLFLLGTRLYRRSRTRFFRMVRTAEDEKSALAAIADEFPLGGEALVLDKRDQDELYRCMLALAKRAKPSNITLSLDDLIGALIVFMIVAATAIPAVIPFLVMEDKYHALRVSNLLLVALLYATGAAWARFAGSTPFIVGMAMTILGLTLVAVALMLGG
jgi:VIT1/CCC1 family predicted Fe2+/Mn2+ transporter